MEKENIKRETNESFILDFIKQQHQEGKIYVFGGTIEDYMRQKNGSKGETTSRMLRRMREYGILECDYVKVSGVRKKVVVYKIKTKNTLF